MDDARLTRRLILGFLAAGTAGLALPVGATEPFSPRTRPTESFPDVGYATWSDDEPAYRFYPGDEIDVAVTSAPELNKQVTVGPDGRISLPLLPPIMAADRNIEELRVAVSQAYASQLLRPDVIIALRQAAPMQVFVGGEVTNPGVFPMVGDLDALRAVMLAGGFRPTARRGEVVIIRRGREGRPMMRTVNLLRALSDPAHADLVPLRRLDIIYVPRTRVSEAGLFIQQYFRELLPVQFSYAFGRASAN